MYFTEAKFKIDGEGNSKCSKMSFAVKEEREFPLRRSPRLAKKRRASMSTIDDLNHILETSERKRKIVKKSKPSVKALKHRSTLGQQPDNIITGMTNSSSTSSDAEELFMKPSTSKTIQNNKITTSLCSEFKKPPAREKRRSRLNEFAVPRSKVKTRMTKQKDAELSTPSHSRRKSRLSLSLSTSERKGRKRKAKSEDVDDVDEVDFPSFTGSSPQKHLREDQDEDEMDTANVTLTGYRTLTSSCPRYDDDNISVQSFTMLNYKV